MCDYSLMHVKSRDARVGDKLVTRNFGTGTRGFVEAGGDQDCAPATARVSPFSGFARVPRSCAAFNMAISLLRRLIVAAASSIVCRLRVPRSNSVQSASVYASIQLSKIGPQCGYEPPSFPFGRIY
jgi:hypothetical protein